ncbi:MAG: hypothetical protein LQ337_003929 [Flavoplaca oasis]|nr:MAG: hypothetical protein LQ337_003929 [Flavoplaca oasis]
MSSTQNLKFSPEGQDTNDDQSLAKHLQEIKLDFPATYGGMMQNEPNPQVTFDSFNTHTPPDIQPNTRLIAVLGLSPEEAVQPSSMWFISDYFAFWNLFNGVTPSQTWLHCLDFQKLIDKNGLYLHGNPYKTRKVVLNQTILSHARTGNDPLQHADPVLLMSKFRERTKSECRAAAAAGENVLLMMFGHGDCKSSGIYLGGKTKSSVFKPNHLKLLLKGLKVNVAMLTTQCFGGGWACFPKLDLTTMAAAGSGDPSKAWRYSGSCGRACGSMFATAIINKLTMNPLTNRPLAAEPDDDDDDTYPQETWTGDQHESYAIFCKAVYESLLRDVDRRGLEHHVTFSAQEDAWTMCWSQRTGIPLEDFKQRWAALDEYPADATLHPGDPFNRDPNVSEELREEYKQLWSVEKKRLEALPVVIMPSAPGEATGSVLGKRKMSGRYGGNVDSLIDTVKVIGAEYLRSYPHGEDSGNSGGLHYNIVRIINGEEKDQTVVEEQLRHIQYRMEQQAAADRYLEMMQIPPPENSSCCDFMTDKAIGCIPRNKFRWMIEQVCKRDILFPDPTEEQGYQFEKGPFYIMIAFHLAGTKDDEIVAKLRDLIAIVEEELDQQKALLKRDPEVTSKRQKLFQAFGLGIMSPRKRRSLAV